MLDFPISLSIFATFFSRGFILSLVRFLSPHPFLTLVLGLCYGNLSNAWLNTKCARKLSSQSISSKGKKTC